MSTPDSEVAWKILDNISQWLRFSDAKATGILSANFVLVGLFSLLSDGSAWWVKGLAITSVVFAVISIVFAILSISPTLKVGESDSIIYYGHIAKRVHPNASTKEIERIRKTFDQDFLAVIGDSKSICNEIADQVWANSLIAWKKYRRVTMSIRWFTAALAPVMVLILLKIATL